MGDELSPVFEKALFFLGAWLTLDDFEDIGKVDRLHHWIIGIILIIISLIIKILMG